MHRLRRILVWLSTVLPVLVPGAAPPDGGYYPCLGTEPPHQALQLLPADPPDEAYLPPPAEPEPRWPVGYDDARVYQLMRDVLGLEFDLGYRFVRKYGRFFDNLEEVHAFRDTGQVPGLEEHRPVFRTWPPRPTGRPLPIQNADFEAPAVEHGAPEVVLIEGWHPWFRPTLRPGYNHRPEYKPEPYRVRSGSQAQKMFTTYATHDAGFAQAARITPGQRLRFSIWAYVWSSSFDHNRASYRPGSYCLQVGIDDVWSQPEEAYDRWVRLEVEAVARSEVVVLRTRGFIEHPVKHNDAYWDDALLEALP